MSSRSEGALSGLAMDTSTIDANSEAYFFFGETLSQESLITDSGNRAIRGSRSHTKERSRQTLQRIIGDINLEPSPTELDNILPKILGASASGDTFAVAETLPSFNVAIDRIAKVHTYSGCVVSRAVFSGSQNGYIRLKATIMGTGESEGNSGTFPAVTYPTDSPYILSEGVLTLEGGTRLFNQFALIVDNVIVPEYNNSLLPTSLCPNDRRVYLAVNTPYTSSETTLYTTPEVSDAGAAGTLVFTSGSDSITFSLANLKPVELRTPTVRGKRQIRFQTTYQAFMSGSTNEIEVTNVNAA